MSPLFLLPAQISPACSFCVHLAYFIFFCGASLVAQWERICLPMQEMWVWSLGRRKSPGEGNGNPLQYSCLENPTDRGAWRATVHGVAKEMGNGWTRLSEKQQQSCSLEVYTCLSSSPVEYMYPKLGAIILTRQNRIPSLKYNAVLPLVFHRQV